MQQVEHCVIDGHLRRDLTPDMEVEVLGVKDDEARALLLSIDPLAALAETQQQLHDRLVELTPTVSPDLQAAWQATADAVLRDEDEGRRPNVPLGPEQWLILIPCRDEKQQIELLGRFQSGAGLPSAPLVK